MAKKIDQLLANEFKCPKCDNKGARVERLAMSGTGLSRFMEIQAYRFAFASCLNCGFTEVYNLRILEGRDDIGNILEVLFMD